MDGYSIAFITKRRNCFFSYSTEVNKQYTMVSYVITALQLFLLRTDQKLPSGALPKSCGAKQFEVDGSAEENDRLQRYIDDYTSILSHPRSTLK